MSMVRHHLNSCVYFYRLLWQQVVTLYCCLNLSSIVAACMITCEEDKGNARGCPPHLICDYDRGYCITPTGARCDSPSDCPDKQYCDGQVCVDSTSVGKSCTQDSGCGESFVTLFLPLLWLTIPELGFSITSYHIFFRSPNNIFVEYGEVCLMGICECLRGHDSKCVEYPISCRKESCEELLPYSTCDTEIGWYVGFYYMYASAKDLSFSFLLYLKIDCCLQYKSQNFHRWCKKMIKGCM